MLEARIVVLRNDGSDGVMFPLPESRNKLIFGRGEDCDVRIQRPTVRFALVFSSLLLVVNKWLKEFCFHSHEHAVLERQSAANSWVLRHLSSSNPTYLNGINLFFFFFFFFVSNELEPKAPRSYCPLN